MKPFFKILFAPLLWSLQACSPLGDPVDKEISNNHYYNSAKTKVIYSAMGNWFELGKTEMKAEVESFEVLTPLLGKDDHHIFYEAYPVKNLSIDPKGFRIKKGDFMTHIGFDENCVFSFSKKLDNKKYSAIATVIEDADPDTYTQSDWDWGRDGTFHYFRNKKIDCDYESFEVLNDYFAKDKNTAFVRLEGNFDPFRVDIDTFVILEDSSHGIDKDSVYWISFFSGDKSLIRIPQPDPKTVEYLNRYFLKIKDSLYYDGKIMPSIDANTFEVINSLYTKDARHVYYKNQVIPEADVTTFTFESGKGVHDKNGTYREGKRIETDQRN